MSTLAVSSAITTLPAVSIAASAAPERALAWVYAATSSAPLSRARLFSVHWVLVTAFASQLPADAGSWLRQQEMFRTAIGSLVTTSRTAMPAQTQLWNAWHQCSAPLIRTGPCASSAVPMPFVPTAHSDQQNQGARLDVGWLWRAWPWSPHSARIRPVASVTVTTPPTLPTSWATDAARKPELGEDDVVFGRVVDLRDGDRSLGRGAGRPGTAPGSDARRSPPRAGHPGLDPRPARTVPTPRARCPCPGSPTWARADVHPSWWRTAFGPSPARDGRAVPLVAAGPTADRALRRASSCSFLVRAVSRVRTGTPTISTSLGLRHTLSEPRAGKLPASGPERAPWRVVTARATDSRWPRV